MILPIKRAVRAKKDTRIQSIVDILAEGSRLYKKNGFTRLIRINFLADTKSIITEVTQKA